MLTDPCGFDNADGSVQSEYSLEQAPENVHAGSSGNSAHAALDNNGSGKKRKRNESVEDGAQPEEGGPQPEECAQVPDQPQAQAMPVAEGRELAEIHTDGINVRAEDIQRLDPEATSLFGYHAVEAVDRAMAPLVLQYKQMSVKGSKKLFTTTCDSPTNATAAFLQHFQEGAVTGHENRKVCTFLLDYPNGRCEDIARALQRLNLRFMIVDLSPRLLALCIKENLRILEQSQFNGNPVHRVLNCASAAYPALRAKALQEAIILGPCVTGNIFVSVGEGTYASVAAIARSLTQEQIASLRCEAKTTDPKHRSNFQKMFLAVLEEARGDAAKTLRVNVVSLKLAEEMHILPLAEFVGLDTLLGTSLCEINRLEVTVSFTEFASNPEYYREYSVLLCGDMGLGKTPLARAACLQWSVALQHIVEKCPLENVTFVECNEIDSLKTAQDVMGPNVPLLLDEVDLRDAAQLQFMSPSVAKLLLSVSESATLRARHFNVRLFPRQPRIFTSNAAGLKDWIPQEFSPVDTAAIAKRVFVFRLDRRVTPCRPRPQATSADERAASAAAARQLQAWHAARIE